ncbi:adenosine receptor A2b-like [Mytilus californianus]|uniref:adenosine receptor A2b-like n=1 Tax=Mytilus californianus TaxID=6549 RepID=UPI002246B0DC|nr:adenosine receptor A2b-like [Mytilus californianus]
MNEKDRGIIQLICGIPIIFANGIVLHILWKYINISVPGNILMLNLSSADILVGIVLIWQAIFNLIDYLQVLPVQYFVILFSMCTMYVMMCRAAVTKRRQIVSVESNLVLNSRLMKFQHELRAAKFMAVILVIFMFCWTPFAISLVYQASATKLNELLIHISEISAFFGVLNSFVNPVVYPLQNRRFRNATYQIFGRIKKRFAKPQQDTFSTVI